MSIVNVVEVASGWVVTVETATVGQLQRYHCSTLRLAQRWASILGAPRRKTMATPLPMRAPQPSGEEEVSYTVTWVGPPEIAGAR